MGIYRGAGGTGDAVNDASSEASLIRDLAIEVQADADASALNVTAAQAAETQARISQGLAADSATTAASSASSASSSASIATTQATNAATSATTAQAAQTAAELAETNAETAEINAETAASQAATSATNAANSASAASTSATNASNSATAAATSATNASNSASSASSSASAASTSASNAAISESNAAASAAAAVTTLSTSLLKANNLSDLNSVSTARTNLGLGSLAVKNTVGSSDIDDASIISAKLASSIDLTSVSLQLKRGITSQQNSFTGAIGEVTVDTTKDTVVVHDGSTAGGFPLAKEKFVQTGSGAVSRTVDEKLKERVTLQDFGGVGDGVADNTTAFNNAIAALTPNGGVLYIPEGDYKFNSKPNNISGGISIIGAGYYWSRLFRSYTESSSTDGFFNFAGASNGGGSVKDLTLFAASGTTGGSAINIEAGTTYSNGDMIISDINVTGDGTWNYNLRADGSAKVTAAQGVRIVRVRHNVFFQSTVAAVYLKSVNNWSLVGNGVFTNTGDAFVLDATSDVPSNYVNADFTFCDSVKLGETAQCNQIIYKCPNTTTLSTWQVFNIALMGKISTLTQNAGLGGDSGAIGYATKAKVIAGKLAGTSGGGSLETADSVTFPATRVSSSNANTLDAYEEGTFTPTIGGSTTPGTTTYTVQQGKYTRVGNVINFQCRLGWSNIVGGVGNLRVSGLPFVATSDTNYLAPVSLVNAGVTVGSGLQMSTAIVASSSQVTLYSTDPATGTLAQIAIDTAGNLYIAGSYHV